MTEVERLKSEIEALCCCPPNGDTGCGCRSATLAELVAMIGISGGMKRLTAERDEARAELVTSKRETSAQVDVVFTLIEATDTLRAEHSAALAHVATLRTLVERSRYIINEKHDPEEYLHQVRLTLAALESPAPTEGESDD